MELICVGNVVNTHGLKGEVRLISDFKYKETVFKKGNNLYIGYDKEHLKINSYRKHKMYDMLTFDNINSIEDVIGYKGDKVYINREEFNFDGILDEDIIGMNVYGNDALIGKVTTIMKSSVQNILVVENENSKSMIPFVDEFILNIDTKNKRIDIKVIEGLINEN